MLCRSNMFEFILLDCEPLGGIECLKEGASCQTRQILRSCILSWGKAPPCKIQTPPFQKPSGKLYFKSMKNIDYIHCDNVYRALLWNVFLEVTNLIYMYYSSGLHDSYSSAPPAQEACNKTLSSLDIVTVYLNVTIGWSSFAIKHFRADISWMPVTTVISLFSLLASI